MWRPLLCLALLLIVSPAFARHRHWHHHHASSLERTPSSPRSLPERQAGQSIDENRPNPATRLAIPPGWTEQSSDSKPGGKRVVSPGGRAWFETYTTDVSAEPIPAHMRSFAFGTNETLTFIRGQSDRIEVAGVKGDRRFYRKAIIACAGRVWHQIAFEYPLDMRQYMQALLQSASSAVDASENVGCENTDTPAVSKDRHQRPARHLLDNDFEAQLSIAPPI